MYEKLKAKILEKNNTKKLSLWFVRHGQSEGNVLSDSCPVMHDTSLTKDGIRESEQIVQYFKKNNINVTDIYTSPQKRSYETAEVIAKAFNLTTKIKKGLQERNWGEWKGLKWKDVSDKLNSMPLENRYTFVPALGESWKEMEERLFATLEEITDENTVGENVLVVMHRGGLRAVLPMLAKVGREKHEDFSVQTGAISKFSFEKDGFDFVGLVPKIT